MTGGEDIVWRIRDRMVSVRKPMVMGVINATPDSFFADSRTSIGYALQKTERMLRDGAAILDIGGASSRPGATQVDEDEELRRILPVIDVVHRTFPEALLSVDTWRSQVAMEAVAAGAGMINDIGAGLLDGAMLTTVAQLKVPYVAMHMQGTPATMQRDPNYADVAAEVARFLSARLNAARAVGIADVIVDPGFGFGKNTAHNYALLNGLGRITALGAPVMVGLSRKRMINEVLGTDPANALNGTTALNTIALMRGAAILRVHDVREAMECAHLIDALRPDQK